MVGRLHALFKSVKTVERRVVFPDRRNVRLAVDFVFHAEAPEDAVYDHASKTLTFKVSCGSHSRAKEPVGVSLGVF